jgi:hypothetical protein
LVEGDQAAGNRSRCRGSITRAPKTPTALMASSLLSHGGAERKGRPHSQALVVNAGFITLCPREESNLRHPVRLQAMNEREAIKVLIEV